MGIQLRLGAEPALIYQSNQRHEPSLFQEIIFDHGEVRSICTFDRESYNEGIYQVSALEDRF